MSADEAMVFLLRAWLEKADNDLKAATHIFALGRNAPTDTICFHAQQCIEKYLKALLVFRGIDFPKTHNLVVLMNLIPQDDRPELNEESQVRLTKHATVLRYPGEEDDPSLAEARKAVAIARRVRKEVRRVLPRAALRRKKS
jgi:HEPN domain-containing protein